MNTQKRMLYKGIFILASAPGILAHASLPPRYCTQAKGGFGACVDRGYALAECLPADNGFADCAAEGEPVRRCLPAKAGYADCRKDGYAPNECLGADAGYATCRTFGETHVRCLAAKAGYRVCREQGYPHADCLHADQAFLQCRQDGLSDAACGPATPSYAFCRSEGMSPAFCVRAGNGYQACRQLAYPAPFCLKADDGFAACARRSLAEAWTDPALPEEKPVGWLDETSQTHYLLLKKKRSYGKAFLACTNRSWSLFNPSRLSAEEWDRFRDSPIYAALEWTVRFAGDPGENRETTIWTARNYLDFSGVSADALTFKYRKVDDKEVVSHALYAAGEDGAQFATVCFFRGEAWYRCSADVKCVTSTLATSPGSAAYYVPSFTDSRRLEESGPSRQQVWEALLDAAKASSTSAEPGPRVECGVEQESFQCVQEH